MPITTKAAVVEIFDLLKASTANIHAQVEERVPVFEPQFDMKCYVELLERFYGFWAPMEARLLLAESLRHPELTLLDRMKSHLLKQDLRTLGCDCDSLPQCGALPEIQTFAGGLGCLYVLEGSTLGARVISRRLESHLRLGPHSGSAFFNAYGGAVAQRWSEFRSFVTSHLAPEQAAEMVIGAVQTFETLFAWLKVPSRRARGMWSRQTCQNLPVAKLEMNMTIALLSITGIIFISSIQSTLSGLGLKGENSRKRGIRTPERQ